jgi:hypothetical protein
MSARSWYQRNKYDRVTIPIIAVISTLLLTAFVLVPQIQQISSEYDSLKIKRENLKLISEKANLLANLDISELNSRAASLQGILPTNEDLGYFVVATRNISSRAGVSLVGVNFFDEEQDEDESGNATLLSVKINGTLDGIRGAVLELERSAPISEIVTLTSSKLDSSQLYTANILVKFYYEPLPESLSKIGQSLTVITAANEKTYETLLDFTQPDLVSLPRVPVGNVNLML